MTPLLLERELDLGKQWYREKSLEEAALQFRRVVQMARLTPSSDRLVEARALGNHATVLKDLHKLDEAILAYRFCCRILATLGEKALERRMLNGLSLCYVEAGRHADARDVCLRLLALTEREDNQDLIRKRLEEVEERMREAGEGVEGVGGGAAGDDGGFVVGTSFIDGEEGPHESTESLGAKAPQVLPGQDVNPGPPAPAAAAAAMAAVSEGSPPSSG